MKNLAIVGIIIVLILIPSKVAFMKEDHITDISEEIRKIAEDQLDYLNIDKWDEFANGLNKNGDYLSSNVSIREMIINIVSGNFQFNWNQVFQTIGATLFDEITLNLSFMVKIFAIAIITGILNNFKSNFSNASVGELAWMICYIMIVVLIIQSISLALNIGKNAIEQMISFMQILFPALLALLIGMGGIASSGIMQPATVLLSGITGVFLKSVMIPLIYLSTILVLVGNINDNINLKSLSKLTKNICNWILGIVFTVFIGVLSMQGILAASFDGISIRTTKYAIENFVPVVGKMFSQTVDILVSCSLMLKNAVGVVGLIVAIGLCLYPTLKILSLMFAYKICGALLEPISDKRIVTCLNEIGSILLIFFITIAGIAIMFFLTIALFIGIGNMTIMMR